MKYLFLALSAALLFAACTRNSTPSLTRLDMLRAGKWTMSSGTLGVKLPNGRDTLLNYLNFTPTCNHDDYIVFSSPTAGAVYSNSDKCSLADADSTQFTWGLSNNNNDISFYRGFSQVWSVTETILPLAFDTTSQSPLVLDTVHGILDTLPGFTRVIPVLDSIWRLDFTRDSVPTFNIANAIITSFSASSFTIFYTMYATYPDSTGYHTGQIIDATATPPAIIDFNPVIRADTFKYTVTYSNM